MGKAEGFNLLLKLLGSGLLSVETEGSDSYDGSRPSHTENHRPRINVGLSFASFREFLDTGKA